MAMSSDQYFTLQAVANLLKPKVDMSIIGALKREPNGRSFHCLGADGVMRVWHFDDWVVIDAVGLSSAQIKEYLERRPFDQATEDKFRGVDGRGVSKENMFSPREEIIPERPPQWLVDKHRREHEERKRNGFPRTHDPNAVSCRAKRSIYNLSPK
jgi:hypothetical protein